ncbi:MAG: hypothetical protein PHT99_00450 [Methanoregula sp.]|nr:hypothetical protein [Methanoregula sp.]
MTPIHPSAPDHRGLIGPAYSRTQKACRSEAAILAGIFAVPLGIFLLGRAEFTLAFIGAAVLFLPLFIFLPKLIQRAMKADADAVIEAFGKNEQVKKVFWILFVAMAGLVLAQVADPALAVKVVAVLAGT